ncbi:eukaryotic translation initiation factor 3 subunit 7 [Theileria orientalis strain Shintoku]|uniref:Eukaryotic translation initiation factor 3 subunit D n=1 Tax=Theileria orientalis strain Shintoku TaxID=869250 RepID=J4DPJ7_THEOR|nr:eukaryotic translation initiation factor 3 subunit 7 [Theileria orientalis strain Shintoku]BAM40824.1 eukaryotic translation initiation factor 3 subunit 7 [Theileria orientalis strain Shintoku]|eukprot:XP_009691125.1 eukaryotic translation initiation factor 3 subunit 7 [Theileria orientalis strain Shintoku]
MFDLKLVINTNKDGWGPDETDQQTVATCLDSINKFPFEPRLKLDKQIHICDFTYGTYQRNTREGSRANRFNTNTYDDEFQFQTVDSRTVVKTRPTTHYKKKVVLKQTTQAFNQKVMEEEQLQFSKQKQYPDLRRQKYLMKNRSLRLPVRYQALNEWSVEPTPTWNVVAEIPFNLLLKQEMNSNLVTVEDLFWRGKLGVYDKKMDYITSKTEVTLQHLSNSFDYYWTSTHDDDCIADVLLETYRASSKPSEEAEGQEASEKSDPESPKEKQSGNMPLQAGSASYDKAMKIEKELLKYDKIVLAATDQILAVLMTAARSKYSWHLNITKIENQIIIDKANGSIVDMLTVNETAPDPPQPDCEIKINRPASLRYEAVKVNQNLRQQVLIPDEFAETYDDPPFVEESDTPATIAYRYRKFTIPGSQNAQNFEKLPIMVVTRCEVHGKLPGTDNYAYVCALNECPNKNNKSWRSQIETQKGALLANEIRNNTTKLQRFVACANMAGCSVFKLAYVTRKSPMDAENHSIIGVHTHTTGNLALQMGFSLNNAWGSIKSIVQLIIRKPDGQYVLLKDPMKPIVRLYSVSDEEDLTKSPKVQIPAVGMWKATDRGFLVGFQHSLMKARNFNRKLGFIYNPYDVNFHFRSVRSLRRPNPINGLLSRRKIIRLNTVESNSAFDLTPKHKDEAILNFNNEGVHSIPFSPDKNDSTVDYELEPSSQIFDYNLLSKRVERILLENLNDKDAKNQLCALNCLNLFASFGNFVDSLLKAGLLSNLLGVLEKPYKKNIWKLVNTYIWPNKPPQASELFSVQELVLKILISLAKISDKVSGEMAKNEELKGLLLKIYCVYNQLRPQQDTVDCPEGDRMKSLISELFLELGYKVDENVTLVSPKAKDSESKDESWTWEKMLPFSSSEENGPAVSLKDCLIPIEDHTHKARGSYSSNLTWIPYYYAPIDSKQSILRNLRIYLGQLGEVAGLSDLEKLTLKQSKVSSKSPQLLGLLAVNHRPSSADSTHRVTDTNDKSAVEILCNINMEPSDELNLSLLTKNLLNFMRTSVDFGVLNDIFTELWALLALKSPEVLNALHSDLDLDLISDILNYSCFDFDPNGLARENYMNDHLANNLANNLRVKVATDERASNIFDRLTRLRDLVKDHFENSPKGSIANMLYNFVSNNSRDSSKISVDLDEINTRIDRCKSERVEAFMKNNVESAKVLQMTLFGFLVELIYVDGNRIFTKIRDHESLINSIKKVQRSTKQPVKREEIDEEDLENYRPLIDKRLELKTVATTVFNQENLNADLSAFDSYKRLTLNGIDFLDIRLNSWKNQKMCLKEDLGTIYNSNKLLNILGYHDDKLGNRGVRILSIDGGGSKGVIALEILDALNKHLNRPLHECFDIICGTSTGGLLASLIALEKMQVSEIKNLYDSLIKSIFVRDGYHVTGTRLLMKQAIYDDNIFKDILKTSLEEIELIDYSVDPTCPKFFCVSTQMDVTPLRPIIWRNYNYHKHVYSLSSKSSYSLDDIAKLIRLNGGSCTIRLRDAIKATTAALGYFPLFERNGHMYGDGALYCNNPAVVALLEAKLLYPDRPISLLVSVGNGVCKLGNGSAGLKQPNGDSGVEHDTRLVGQSEYISSLLRLHENCMDHGNQHGAAAKKENKLLSLEQVITHITYAATTSEMTHSALEFTMPENVYFRFSPVIPTVKIDETSPEVLKTLKAQTRQYLGQDDIQERLGLIRRLIEASPGQAQG